MVGPHEGFATFYLDPKVPTKASLFMNDCQVIVAEEGYEWDLLFHHLPDVTLIVFIFFFFNLLAMPQVWDLGSRYPTCAPCIGSTEF